MRQYMETAVKDRPSLELGYVYGIKSLDLIKVGVAKDVKARLFKIQGSNPHGCQIVFQRFTIAPYIYELKMHDLLAEHAVGREWFRVTVDQLRAASKIASAHTKRTYRELDAPYAEIRLAALQERQSAFLSVPRHSFRETDPSNFKQLESQLASSRE